MSDLTIDADDLVLVLKDVEELRQMISQIPPEHLAQISPAWLEMVTSATSADPWLHGFSIVRKSDRVTVGSCGFKGPPSSEGIVEIAYAIEPDYQGLGYATIAAMAQTEYAFSTGNVRLVCAHTLPESNASTRVLTKCGFQHVGEVIDPDDGRVWRWEKSRIDTSESTDQ